MVIILKDNTRKIKIFSSIRTKYLLSYFLLIAIVLVMLNTYPLIISRNLVFSTKQTAMKSQVAQISTSLEALDSFNKDSIEQVVSLLEVDGLDFVVVTNAKNVVLYSSKSAGVTESDMPETKGMDDALSGKDAFYSSFADGAFSSCAAMPILSNGEVLGAVYAYEYDSVQGNILLELQKNLQNVSIGVTFMWILMSVLFSNTLTGRIKTVLEAIKTVREGEYSYRVSVSGNDELAKLGDEFNSLTDRLQSTEEIRRRFVADASHELKTPLASIRLLSDSILQTTDMDSALVHEFVEDIGNEAERLARTTEKLLNLTRLDNKIIYERTSVDICPIVSSVMKILKPLADESNVSIECSCEENCTVWAVEDDLYQIVLNLAENAVKYNNYGGKVNIELKKIDGTIFLTVEDTGIGIPEQDIPNIFDRFYRVDKARSREAGGSGLGLSIVKSTVEEHDGTVKAEHREEGGMRFVVTFPLYSK